jgi:PAS domain S-box-containing protein
MKISLRLSLLLLLAQPLPAQLLPAQMPEVYDEWRWVRFDLYSGLSSPFILDLVELPIGVPWLHLRSGLAWYDGFQWEDVPLDSLVSAEISRGRISVDSTGVLLVIPPRLYRVNAQGETWLTPTVNGTPLAINRAFYLQNQGIMLQGDTALFLYTGDTTVLVPSPYQHPLVRTIDHPFGLWQTTNGALWLTAPQGLFRWVNHTWRLWYVPPDGEYMSLESIVENSHGVGALSAQLNIRQISVDWAGGTITRAEITDPSTAIATADISPDGRIIAQRNSGLLSIYTGGKWQPVNPPPQQMLNARVFRFRANGDLWVGKEGSLFLCSMSSRRWTVLESGLLPETKSVNELLFASDSTLWVGTSAGIMTYKDGRLTAQIDRVSGVPLHVVTGLGRDPEGNIWASSGASFDGAYRWDGKSWKHFGGPEGLCDSRIHRILPDRTGRLWFLTISAHPPGLYPATEHGIYLLDKGKFSHIGVKDGLLNNRVYAFAQDSAGAYWFGTLDGVSRLKGNTWKHWSTTEGMISNRVFTLAADRSGRVWFGHQRQGLGYFDENEHPRYVDQTEGMTSRAIWSIVPAPDGKLWIATRDGLFVNNDGLWATIGPAQGLPNPLLWPLLVTHDRVYIGTSGSGVAVLQYSLLETPPPRVHYEDPVQQGSSNVISWQVEPPWELIPSNEVKVRYRVDDQPWSDWSEERSVTLSSLSVGAHTFAVQAKGIIGQVAHQPQPIIFTVQPPLFLRPVFYGPVGALLAAIAALVVVFVRRKRQYDRTLREQDARFRAVVEHQTELIVRLLPDGRLSFVNEAFCRLLQKTRDELVGQTIMTVMTGDGNAEPFDRLLHESPSGSPVEMDRRFRTPSGEDRWLRWTSSAIRGDLAEVAEIQMIGRDITERKAAEENLVRSEERYRVVAEQTGQLLYDYDIPFGTITWAGAIQQVTGFSAAEFGSVTIRGWEEMVHEEDRAQVVRELELSVASGRPYRIDYRFRHKSGLYIDVYDNGIFLLDKNGKSVRMLGTMTDITERRRAEAQIAASLKEKEVLLKEIHHRVKNNLQVISSLLNLQAANVVDGKTLEQLRESQNRIRSMALIHERLYQSGNLARIDFGEYVRSLVGFLARSYSMSTVRVVVNVQSIDLPVNTAIPCGLIINELVSNALKYAFPGGREGEVNIDLVVKPDGSGVLSVRDDGIGLPAELVPQKTTTLGLQLVNTLTKQLNGSIEMMRGNGTTFSITFPLEV